jgi:antitoxin VapB
VSREGDKIILEPMETPPFDAEAFWAKIDAFGGPDFPEVTDDDLRPDLDANSLLPSGEGLGMRELRRAH